jgi:hypothetical protein
MRDKDAQLMMEALREVGPTPGEELAARQWKDPNPKVDTPLTADEALTQVKVELDKYFTNPQSDHTNPGPQHWLSNWPDALLQQLKAEIFTIVDKWTPQSTP